MKKGMFLCGVMLAFLSFSCSTDDDTGGGGGGIDQIVRGTLYATSNSKNTIGIYKFTPQGVAGGLNTVSSNNNEGIFYNKEKDELIINSRQQKVVNIYGNIKNAEAGTDLSLKTSSSSVLQNPRDVVENGNYLIVSDGELGADEGKYLIFERDEEGLTLRNTLTVEFDVWGMLMIGNDLYATIPNTGDVAVFKNFVATHTTDATIAPDKRITLGGMNNLRGIAADQGIFVFTDAGEIGNTIDGSFSMVYGFVQKLNNVENGGTMAASEQLKVSGQLAKLGDPVGVAYNDQNKVVMIAENIHNGGAVHMYQNVEVGGEIPPVAVYPLEKASSVFYSSNL